MTNPTFCIVRETVIRSRVASPPARQRRTVRLRPGTQRTLEAAHPGLLGAGISTVS